MSMLRKLAVALIATSMLAAPAFAADASKSTTSTPTAPIAAPAKADAPASGTTATPAVKTVKAEKSAKTVKVATRSHRRHSHRWYVAHHGKHPVHVMTAKVSHPVKHTQTAKRGKSTVHEVKANKAPASKPSQS
jgi:hypothetical protein